MLLSAIFREQICSCDSQVQDLAKFVPHGRIGNLFPFPQLNGLAAVGCVSARQFWYMEDVRGCQGRRGILEIIVVPPLTMEEIQAQSAMAADTRSHSGWGQNRMTAQILNVEFYHGTSPSSLGEFTCSLENEWGLSGPGE